MSTEKYDVSQINEFVISHGKGPNIDRLADSWRYFLDPSTSILTKFEGTIIGDTVQAALDLKGEVVHLKHLDVDHVYLCMCIPSWERYGEVGSKAAGVYNHRTRSGRLSIHWFETPVPKLSSF